MIDLAGNASDASNDLTVAITSTAADYNGGNASDPAVFARNTSSNQVRWLVQTPTGTAPPWFGPSGTSYIPSVSFTGVLTVGSAVLTGVSSTSGLAVGDNINGTGIPAGTTITAINSSTSITLSATATAAGSTNLAATVPSNHVVPFEGDFDGDGRTDLAYYNLATATWTIFESSTAAVQGATTFAMGTPNLSLPVVGHFDANGPTEVAVLTVNAQGQDIFTIASTLSGTRSVNFGAAKLGDIPLAGDFDTIGYDEPAIYQASTGNFLVYNPDKPVSEQIETKTIPGLAYSPDLIPVPGQYDNQAYYDQAVPNGQPIYGTTELAVYDPGTGVFTILGPGNNKYTISGFQPGDIPAPADYLGNGSDQPVAYRPSTGQFNLGSTSGTTTTLATLTSTGGVPITAPLPYRLPGANDSQGGGSGGGSGNTGGGSGNTGGSSDTGGGSGSFRRRIGHQQHRRRVEHRRVELRRVERAAAPPARPRARSTRPRAAPHRPRPHRSSATTAGTTIAWSPGSTTRPGMPMPGSGRRPMPTITMPRTTRSGRWCTSCRRRITTRPGRRSPKGTTTAMPTWSTWPWRVCM